MIQNVYVLAEIGVFKGNPQSYMIFSKPLTTTHHLPYTQFIIAGQSWYFNWKTPIIREVFLVPHPIPTTSTESRLWGWGGQYKVDYTSKQYTACSGVRRGLSLRYMGLSYCYCNHHIYDVGSRTQETGLDGVCALVTTICENAALYIIPCHKYTTRSSTRRYFTTAVTVLLQFSLCILISDGHSYD